MYQPRRSETPPSRWRSDPYRPDHYRGSSSQRRPARTGTTSRRDLYAVTAIRWSSLLRSGVGCPRTFKGAYFLFLGCTAPDENLSLQPVPQPGFFRERSVPELWSWPRISARLRCDGGDPRAPHWRLDSGRSGDRGYRLCPNYPGRNVCNWAIPASDTDPFCASCRLTRVIPNLSAPGAKEAWVRLETAKRRLIRSLTALNLPIEEKRRRTEVRARL